MAKANYLELSDAELVSALGEAKDDVFKLRFQNATGQLSDNAALSRSKKAVAQIKTEIRSREIAAAERVEKETSSD